MPSNRKKHIRARMEKTGESYQTAQRNLEAPSRSPSEPTTASETRIDLKWIIDYWKDGEAWLHGDAWDRVAVISRYASEASSSAAALNRVFSWSWLREFCLGEQHVWHPVIGSHVIIGNVQLLMELGTMLARQPEVLEHVRKRLRLPKEFATASAEVRAGLLFSDAGAILEHEPLRKAMGPDWHVNWRGRTFALEVKHPEPSQRAELASAVIMSFIMKLRTDRLPRPTCGAWLTLHVDPELVRRCVTDNRVNERVIDELIKQVEQDLASRLPHPTQNAWIPMPGIGRFEVLTGLDGEPRFQPIASGPMPETAREVGKLVSLLKKGAQQLAASPLETRVLALDVGRDRSIGNYYAELQAVLEEPWAESISAVVLLGSLDSKLQDSIDLIVRPGQEWEFDWLAECLSLRNR